MIHSDGLEKNIKKESSVAKKSILSLFFGLVAFIFALVISSFIIMNIYIPSEYIFIFVLIASGISAILCATMMCVLQKRRVLILSMIISVILSTIEFLILLCFNNINLSGYVYLLFPIVIFFSFITSVVVLNIKK